MEELKLKLRKAETLSDKMAIRIQMIELNRSSKNPDSSIINPLTTYFRNIQENNYRAVKF